MQAHGNELAFRDIWVKEIKTDEIGLTEEEKAEGFVSLFNGVNLDGWQGNTVDYFAQDGEMVVQPSRGGHGNIFTEKEYTDFIFRFEFQLTPGQTTDLASGRHSPEMQPIRVWKSRFWMILHPFMPNSMNTSITALFTESFPLSGVI